MKKILILLVVSIAIFSCRKDKPIPQPKIEIPIISTPNTPTLPCIGDYNLYSVDTFDFVLSDLINTTTIGPFFYYPDDYAYAAPIFNPNNPYEIIYEKAITNPVTFPSEIWKFSFCTGETTLITDQFYYNLDWGINGWIIFTSVDQRIYKVKDNGDSLTALSTVSGYNRVGKWNPSATLYWNERNNDGVVIEHPDGSVEKIIATLPFGPTDWINDSTLLGWRDNNFYAMNIYSESLTLLNNSWTPSISLKIFDRDNMVCYVGSYVQSINKYPFLKYDLNGSNAVDTLRVMSPSYLYASGDIMNDKIVVSLMRKHWKDSANAQIYVRRNVLLLDSDGTNERMVNLP